MKKQKLLCLFLLIFSFTLIICRNKQVKPGKDTSDPGPADIKAGETILFPEKSYPGLYVHPYPAFSVAYPADWMEMITAEAPINFYVKKPDGSARLAIVTVYKDMPLEETAGFYVDYFAKTESDIKLLFDIETKLRDGRIAREVEIESVNKNGIKNYRYILCTFEDNFRIGIFVNSNESKITEDHKRIGRSLKFKPKSFPAFNELKQEK